MIVSAESICSVTATQIWGIVEQHGLLSKAGLVLVVVVVQLGFRVSFLIIRSAVC